MAYPIVIPLFTMFRSYQPIVTNWCRISSIHSTISNHSWCNNIYIHIKNIFYIYSCYHIICFLCVFNKLNLPIYIVVIVRKPSVALIFFQAGCWNHRGPGLLVQPPRCAAGDLQIGAARTTGGTGCQVIGFPIMKPKYTYKTNIF